MFVPHYAGTNISWKNWLYLVNALTVHHILAAPKSSASSHSSGISDRSGNLLTAPPNIIFFTVRAPNGYGPVPKQFRQVIFQPVSATQKRGVRDHGASWDECAAYCSPGGWHDVSPLCCNYNDHSPFRLQRLIMTVR